MNIDFHYYATYCAAYLAGYTHEESLDIAYSAQFTDCCTRTLLSKIGGPLQAATTQMQAELAASETNPVGLQDITRIWASFHFLPGDLHAEKKKCSKGYLRKYRLICNTNSELLKDTVELAQGRSLQATGLAMHVLADTWAHRYFAGTPSLVINNTDDYFFEIVPDGDSYTERRVTFNHNPASPDDPDKGVYTNSLYRGEEKSIMNLGHGRAGHFPDYCWARYRYMPAWDGYRETVKNNPSDYLHAFCQMIYALKYLRGDHECFELNRYDIEAAYGCLGDILGILQKRQLDASGDWKALGERLSGCEIEPFDVEKYQKEYADADEEAKDTTFLGQYIIAALGQKSMVTNRIFISGSLLAGVSIDFRKKGFGGIKDFRRLIEEGSRKETDDRHKKSL